MARELRQFPGLRRYFLDGQGEILVVELCRGEKRNAMGLSFWRNYPKCFPRPVSLTLIDDQGAEAVEAVEAALMQGVRVVVVCAEGPSFTAGLDVTDAAMMSVIGGGGGGEQQQDAARVAFRARQHVLGMQAALSAAEACPVPVIAAVHGACIGAGVDLITAADVRLCAGDAYFSIREVRLALAADVGTLQRLPKVARNESLVRELAFTGDDFGAADAVARLGLCSRVVEGSRAQVQAAAFALARHIAAQSPVAMAATKANLLYSRDHSVADGLDYVATWNGAALQSRDVRTAAAAAAAAKRKKAPPLFSKL